MIACLLLALGGCGKKPGALPASGKAAAVSNAAPAESAEAPAQPSERELAVIMGQLTQAVRRFGVEQRRVPKDLEEVAAAGYLSAVPVAPAGKKFAINKNLTVYLANH